MKRRAPLARSASRVVRTARRSLDARPPRGLAAARCFPRRGDPVYATRRFAVFGAFFAVLIAGATAAPFTTYGALKAAVDSCLGEVPTGEACCSRNGVNCGVAGDADITDWDVSQITNMAELFRDKWNFNQDISRWNTGAVTDMSRMFSNANSFNQSIGSWDVSRVTDMSGMFENAQNFNRDLSGWNVGRVTNMQNMFWYCEYFNQDIGGWNVGRVTDMSNMFGYARAFNQDISRWNVGAVEYASSMFYEAESFKQDITGWRMAPDPNAEDAQWDPHYQSWQYNDMFQGATAWMSAYVNCGIDDPDTDMCSGSSESSSEYFAGPPGAWQRVPASALTCTQTRPFSSYSGLIFAVSNCFAAVESGEACCSTGGAFCGAACHANMSDWDVSRVKSMKGLFQDKWQFNQDISSWNTGAVTDMSRMFANANSFNQSIGSWDVSKVTTMEAMFEHAQNFNRDLSGWNVGRVTNMRSMFWSCEYFNQDIGGWNVGRVTDMSNMFGYARAFNQDISRWNVGSVEYAYGMFYEAESFKQDITGWRMAPDPNAEDAQWDPYYQSWQYNDMFRGATAWMSAYVNCGIDDPDTDMCSGSSESSSEYFAGPPGAWQRVPASALTCTQTRPFSSYGGLIFAVSNCFAAVESGEACCSTGGAFCGAACHANMSDWDVSRVKSMKGLFQDKWQFNQDISSWNTGAVTDMSRMFANANSFNKSIGSWDVSRVTDMSGMFENAQNFNRDLSGWNVGRVTNMQNMFWSCEYFNQDIGGWNVGRVTDMSNMFGYARAFNQDISRWNVGAVEYASSMFYEAESFKQDITGWRMAPDPNAEHAQWDPYYQSWQYNDMFQGATAWMSAFTNCGIDDSDADVCAGAYESSSDFYAGPPGAWARTTCDASSPPAHGTVGDCTSALPRGTTCSPACDDNYALFSVSECFDDLTFLGALCLDPVGPDCAVTPPEHGAEGDCPDSLRSGTACRPTCDAGYTSSGWTYCSGGERVLATCDPDPCDVPPPANGNPGTCRRSIASGESCQPTCDAGYTASGGTSCFAGVLSPTVCEGNPCQVPATAVPAHGRRGNCESTLQHGASCEFRCDSGFEVSGVTTCRAGTLEAATCDEGRALIFDYDVSGCERTRAVFALVAIVVAAVMDASGRT